LGKHGKPTLSLFFGIDAVFLGVDAASFSVDAVLLDVDAAFFSVDAVLLGVDAASFSVDMAFFSVDAVFLGVNSRMNAIDGNQNSNDGVRDRELRKFCGWVGVKRGAIVNPFR